MEKESAEKPSIQISDLPIEVLQCILKCFSFSSIGKLRMVSKYFNKACSDLLNAEFIRLKEDFEDRCASLKAKMPRRESSRRNHPLADLLGVIETLNCKITIMALSIGFQIKLKHCCFFAGKVLDKYKRVLTHIDKKGIKDTDWMISEIYDLSTMAISHFRSKIEPSLPKRLWNSGSSGNSYGYPLKEPNRCLESNNLGCDTSLQGMKKSLDKLKKITDENHYSLLRLKAHVKSMETDVNNLESLVNEMKNCPKEFELPVNPENEATNILHKIDQCELMLDSIESPPKPKRPKLKTNVPSNTSMDNSVIYNTRSHIAEDLHSLSNSQSELSCSTSEHNGSSYEELQQKIATTKQTSLFLSDKTSVKRKQKLKIKNVS